MRKRAKFSLSHYNLLSMQMGYCVPTLLTEVLPGDSLQMSSSFFMRVQPMLAPVMHPVHLVSKYFFVPTRLLWDGWEDFITGGPDGMDTSEVPQITVTPTQSSLADYLGLPLGKALTVSALPFRAYDLVWNEFFRDQDLQDAVTISTGDGPDTTTSTALLRPCWQKDYFTTARPWPQKGPQVTIPVDVGDASQPTLSFTGQLKSGWVSGSGPLLFFNPFTDQDPTAPGGSADSGSTGWDASSGAPDGQVNLRLNYLPNTGSQISSNAVVSGGLAMVDPTVIGTVGYTPGEASLGSIDVSAFREALALQRFEEARALYGSRYEDYLRYLGVRPQDARLQLPEYLGGVSQTLQFSEVLQTGGDTIGALYGHGILAARSSRIRRFIPEHGYVLGITYVRPLPVYAQGVDRMWYRQTKDDYWQRELQHIGQQEVYNGELYATGGASDTETFGYQNRYDEYRRGVNHVGGEFRTTQDYWHMARIFDNAPVLNGDFVSCVPTDRIYQADATSSDQLYCMIQNNIVAKRLVDKNGNPM